MPFVSTLLIENFMGCLLFEVNLSESLIDEVVSVLRRHSASSSLLTS